MTAPLEEPSLAVQRAITAAVKAGNIGMPIRDKIPVGENLPYVTTGDDIVTATSSEDFERSVSVRSNLHVYVSNADGRPRAKAAVAALVSILDEAALDASPDWTLTEINFVSATYLDDPDGSYHAVVAFRSFLDTAS